MIPNGTASAVDVLLGLCYPIYRFSSSTAPGVAFFCTCSWPRRRGLTNLMK